MTRRRRPGLAAGLAFLLAVGVAGATPSFGAVSTPPPTPVPPSGSPSPFPTALSTPKPSPSPPVLHSAAGFLEDPTTGQSLDRKAAGTPRPIASLTKIMTALTVLATTPLKRTVTVSPSAASAGGSTLGLRAGERITVRNLMYALLLQSSNDAAVALADGVAGSSTSFVAMMNRRAAALHLVGTRFASPSGLDNAGHSTARDLAALTVAAYHFRAFADIVASKSWDIPGPGHTQRHVQNRNVLLWLYPGAIGVKTGFTTPAGHCVVAMARRQGRTLLAVVLGGPTETAAFDDAAALLNFGFDEFQNVALVRRGERLGTATVGGLEIPAVAAADLVKLVRIDRVPSIKRFFTATPSLRLPVHAGQVVGEEAVWVAGRRITAVPTVTRAGAPTPPATSPGSAQTGQLQGAARLVIALLRTMFDGFL